MPKEKRLRVVYNEWVRDPKGKLLEKPPPKGKRTENGIIWGHTLDDFYWIPRIPGVNVLTIWSRSMIQEYGENYMQENLRKDEPAPRRLRPYPCLVLPGHVASSSELGYLDEGCGTHHGRPLRRIADQLPNVATRPRTTKFIGEQPSRIPVRVADAAFVTGIDDTAAHALDGPQVQALDALPAPVPDGLPAQALDAPPAQDVDAPPARALDSIPPAQDPSAATMHVDSVMQFADAEDTRDVGVGGDRLNEGAAVDPPAAKVEVQATTAPPVAETKKSPVVVAAEPIFHDLPKLGEFIPEEFFPDILYVNDPDYFTQHGSYGYNRPPKALAQSREPVRKYKRVAGPPPPAPARTSPPVVPKPSTNLRIAHLNMSGAPCLGTGHHSTVHRAALRLPLPLTARSPTGEVAVAAKTGFSNSEARELLQNEGKIYGAFPQHLMETSCGFNLVAPITHPVPVGAVVPKFYGYYVPVREDVEREKEEAATALRSFKATPAFKAWDRLSPILLLQECGSPITPSDFNADERSECFSLALRLHYAGFTQNSFYIRNILKQAGPLTVAPSERSMSTPEFRIIDFGRGEHWLYKLAARALEICGKAWWDLRDYEVRKAHSELQIRDFNY
ncbi:hypothetical protein C8R46DRAFT_879731 [Mycena filopes]|nr:hypothetical protein C8R46DRAFT_879731 [Mycena filopes]